MVETSVWGFKQPLLVSLRDSGPSVMGGSLANCESLSCPNCGYTELQADAKGLRALLLNRDYDAEQKAAKKRKTRR